MISQWAIRFRAVRRSLIANEPRPSSHFGADENLLCSLLGGQL